jgi:hypothetical protein
MDKQQTTPKTQSRNKYSNSLCPLLIFSGCFLVPRQHYSRSSHTFQTHTLSKAINCPWVNLHSTITIIHQMVNCVEILPTWRPKMLVQSIHIKLTRTISSYVSSSISTVVTISSTSPRIMFKCWSYAWGTRETYQQLSSQDDLHVML